jgi:hypothetical protein
MTATFRIPSVVAAILLAVSPSRSLAAQDPIATDRPDFVESSATVGDGVFQLETSVATDWSTVGSATERTVATPTLIRYGISRSVELRVESDAYTRASVTGTESVDGFSDAAVGLKWHAVDALGLRPATAVLLHADLPSGSRTFRTDGVRPSLRVVGEWELPADFALGVMPGVVYDVDAAGRRQWVTLFGATVGKPVSESLRFFVEFTAAALPIGEVPAMTELDLGTALLLSKDVQLDLSTSFGLSEGAADHAVAIGFSRRWR